MAFVGVVSGAAACEQLREACTSQTPATLAPSRHFRGIAFEKNTLALLNPQGDKFSFFVGFVLKAPCGFCATTVCIY